mgnify:CR=1 FL=1
MVVKVSLASQTPIQRQGSSFWLFQEGRDPTALRAFRLLALRSGGRYSEFNAETPQAIDNADAIAAVPGVDVLLVGTNDLCAEMGIHGDFGNPRLRRGERVEVLLSDR